MAKLAGTGLMGALVPEEYGGAALDYVSYALAVEELNRVRRLGRHHDVGAQLALHEPHRALRLARAEGGATCRGWPAARRWARGASPSPAPAPTRPPCARARCARDDTGCSTAARPSSPTRAWRDHGRDGGRPIPEQKAARASPPSSSSGARPASPPAKPTGSSACTPPTPPSSIFEDVRSPPPRSAARATWASSTRMQVLKAAASRWPPWRWASPRARSTRPQVHEAALGVRQDPGRVQRPAGHARRHRHRGRGGAAADAAGGRG